MTEVSLGEAPCPRSDNFLQGAASITAAIHKGSVRTRAVPAFEWKHRAQAILFDDILDEEELKDLLNLKKMVEEEHRAGGERYQPTVKDTSRQRPARQKKKISARGTEAGEGNEVIVFGE